MQNELRRGEQSEPKPTYQVLIDKVKDAIHGQQTVVEGVGNKAYSLSYTRDHFRISDIDEFHTGIRARFDTKTGILSAEYQNFPRDENIHIAQLMQQAVFPWFDGDTQAVKGYTAELVQTNREQFMTAYRNKNGLPLDPHTRVFLSASETFDGKYIAGPLGFKLISVLGYNPDVKEEALPIQLELLEGYESILTTWTRENPNIPILKSHGAPQLEIIYETAEQAAYYERARGSQKAKVRGERRLIWLLNNGYIDGTYWTPQKIAEQFPHLSYLTVFTRLSTERSTVSVYKKITVPYGYADTVKAQFEAVAAQRESPYVIVNSKNMRASTLEQHELWLYVSGYVDNKKWNLADLIAEKFPHLTVIKAKRLIKLQEDRIKRTGKIRVPDTLQERFSMPEPKVEEKPKIDAGLAVKIEPPAAQRRSYEIEYTPVVLIEPPIPEGEPTWDEIRAMIEYSVLSDLMKKESNNSVMVFNQIKKDALKKIEVYLHMSGFTNDGEYIPFAEAKEVGERLGVQTRLAEQFNAQIERILNESKFYQVFYEYGLQVREPPKRGPRRVQ